jgi:hypothetical protein
MPLQGWALPCRWCLQSGTCARSVPASPQCRALWCSRFHLDTVRFQPSLGLTGLTPRMGEIWRWLCASQLAHNHQLAHNYCLQPMAASQRLCLARDFQHESPHAASLKNLNIPHKAQTSSFLH